MFDLPTPFGPQKTLNPGKNGTAILLLNDLNPWRLILVILVFIFSHGYVTQ
jgi:hypothetical protein